MGATAIILGIMFIVGLNIMGARAAADKVSKKTFRGGKRKAKPKTAKGM